MRKAHCPTLTFDPIDTPEIVTLRDAQILPSPLTTRFQNPAGGTLAVEIVDPVSDGGSLIDSQNEVGGWPDLQTSPSPLDSDQDGIPDEWEIAGGSDPYDPADGTRLTESGYSNLEVYLNQLVP